MSTKMYNREYEIHILVCDEAKSAALTAPGAKVIFGELLDESSLIQAWQALTASSIWPRYVPQYIHILSFYLR